MTLSQIYNQDTGFVAREKINTSFEVVDVLWSLTAGTGSGSDTYLNPNPTTIALGGYPIGSTFPTPQTMQQMWDNLLYPYIAPAFSSFSISGQSSIIEVGVGLSGAKTFIWSTSQSSNVQSNSVIIKDITANVNLATGLSNDGTESVSIGTISNLVPITQTWRCEAVDTQSTTFQSSNFNVSSIYPYLGQTIYSFNGVLNNATNWGLLVPGLNNGGNFIFIN